VRHEPIRQDARLRDDAPRGQGRHDDRRPRRDAAEDGDHVLGFGEFMPDFMRAPRRASRPAMSDAEDAAA
jgi:hypothetical protein